MSSTWKMVLEQMRQELGEEPCHSWIEPLELVELGDGTATLLAPNTYIVEWIHEHHYDDLLRESFSRALGRPIEVDVKGRAHGPDNGVEPRSRRVKGLSLDGSKTFETFVVGACNEFAHAAAQGVAEFPGGRHNPLLIYGGTGLGKTHLVQAIGHAIAEARPGSRILYTTTEKFVNGVINAIRFQRMNEFRHQHRDEVDVLLIDDIQFLSGKDRSQEEFFHTFQELQNSNRQIVLTSDMLPRDIAKLEPRLRTRLDGGLVADIQPPDVETMVAILHSKADQRGFPLPQEIAYWIATRVRNNIREAEGALSRLIACHQLHGGALDIRFAERHLGPIYGQDQRPLQVDPIIETVARFFNLKKSDLLGRRRTKGIARPRQIAMYLARKHTGRSFPDLGRAFHRDQSTIQHACRSIEKQVATDPDIRHTIQAIERGLGL